MVNADTVVHIAGVDVQVGSRLRQRCSWCGATIIDVDLANIAIMVEPGEEPGPHPTWPVGSLVEHTGVDGEGATGGGVTTTVEPQMEDDGSIKLPARACAKLLPDDITAIDP